MAGSQARKAKAEKTKGELSVVAATTRLLLSRKDGPTFESVVPGFQDALDSHDAVEGQYPGDALVEAATNPGFQPPPPPAPAFHHTSGVLLQRAAAHTGDLQAA